MPPKFKNHCHSDCSFDMEYYFLAICIFQIADFSYGTRGVIPGRFACEPNLEECRNPHCNYTKLDKFKLTFSFGCNLTKVHSKVSVRNSQYLTTSMLISLICHLQVHIQAFQKVQKNIYKPILFDVTFNACNMNRNNTMVLQTFFPDIMKQFEKYMHECPYSVLSIPIV
jgi:Protein of unknown function (DUF1091)